jgi:hypothetical protein
MPVIAAGPDVIAGNRYLIGKKLYGTFQIGDLLPGKAAVIQ